jgi:hypothetical protein
MVAMKEQEQVNAMHGVSRELTDDDLDRVSGGRMREIRSRSLSIGGGGAVGAEGGESAAASSSTQQDVMTALDKAAQAYADMLNSTRL